MSLVALDDERARDPLVAGAKAATLAQARAAGLPVLPGCVVPVETGRPVIEGGATALAGGDSGRARLAVMEHPLDDSLGRSLTQAVRDLGGQVVVRSSSPLEHHAVWAGAFSSYDGVGVDEVMTAVRGVWASAFTVDALDRCDAVGLDPAAAGLAALLQPEVGPVFGGTARCDGPHVDIVAVKGSPAHLLSGRERGVRANALPGSAPTGEAVDVCGSGVVTAVAHLSRQVSDTLGLDLVEWAWVDDGVVLLQARTAATGRGGRSAPAPSHEVTRAMALPEASRLVSWVSRFPGPLAESLVLPWALSVPVLGAPAEPRRMDGRAALDRARHLSRALEAHAWGTDPSGGRGQSEAVLRGVREHRSPQALCRLGSLTPVDEEEGREVLALLHTFAAWAADSGLVTGPQDVWQHTPQALHPALDGNALPRRHVAGTDGWEPFVVDFLRCEGTPLGGAPAAPGLVSGWARPVDHPDAVRASPPHPVPRRDVLVAPHPMPSLASLLWSAAGLVTGPGDASAHLFEVAASLRVPAVVDADVDDLLTGASGQVLVALDGQAGRAWAREV